MNAVVVWVHPYEQGILPCLRATTTTPCLTPAHHRVLRTWLCGHLEFPEIHAFAFSFFLSNSAEPMNPVLVACSVGDQMLSNADGETTSHLRGIQGLPSACWRLGSG